VYKARGRLRTWWEGKPVPGLPTLAAMWVAILCGIGLRGLPAPLLTLLKALITLLKKDWKWIVGVSPWPLLRLS
jgi:hypothetical protein